MTKMTLGSHPFLLGFDQLERMLEQAEKSGTDTDSTACGGERMATG